MANKRILDETTASVAASDDYLYIDGQTNGSRKITPENIVLNSTTAQLLTQHIADATQEVGEIEDDIADLRSDLGDLSELETEDKSSLVNAINEARGSGGSGLTADIKTALLQIAQKVAYIDEDGQDYYDDLYDALYAITAITLNTNSISLQSIGATSQLTATTTPAGGNVTWSSSNTSVATVSSTGLVTSAAYGSATITATAGSVSATCSVVVAQATCTGITATYTQSGTVYDTDSLDSLKTDLVVTASWSDSTTSTLASTDYTLSGTLAEGTSTITVSYGGKTDTFSVTVSEVPSYHFVFYQGYGSDNTAAGKTPISVDGEYKYASKVMTTRTTSLDFEVEFEPNSTYEMALTTELTSFKYGLQFYAYSVFNEVNTAIAQGEGATLSNNPTAAYDPGWLTYDTLYIETGSILSNGHDVSSINITDSNGNSVGTKTGSLYGFRITATNSNGNASIAVTDFDISFKKI